MATSYDQLVQDVSVEASTDLVMIEHFLASIGSAPDAAVLDAGCGAGRMITHLEELAPTLSIVGVDLAGAMVDLARARHPSRRIEQGDLAALPFSDPQFAGVLGWYSIIHTPLAEIPEILAEFRRVLRPEGSLLLAFHAGDGERIVHGAYGHDVDLTVQLHDVHRMGEALTDGGFTVQETSTRAARPGEKNPQGFLLSTRT